MGRATSPKALHKVHARDFWLVIRPSSQDVLIFELWIECHDDLFRLHKKD